MAGWANAALMRRGAAPAYDFFGCAKGVVHMVYHFLVGRDLGIQRTVLSVSQIAFAIERPKKTFQDAPS